jgi:transaldolase/glucose-6-phosphate isomerase
MAFNIVKAQRQRESSWNLLERLHDSGQAVWLDFLSRRFIAEGGLKKLIVKDGVTGVTSNPSIFEKAITGSTDYDSSLKTAENHGHRDAMALYEQLAIEDIQHAADALRPVYEATERRDGYVSLEVSPYLAMSSDATVVEARRLWRAVRRDNLMIKVPATKPGLPAICQLIGEGINVNITLLFSQQVYEEVVEAYLAGLEHLVTQGGDPRNRSIQPEARDRAKLTRFWRVMGDAGAPSRPPALENSHDTIPPNSLDENLGRYLGCRRYVGDRRQEFD